MTLGQFILDLIALEAASYHKRVANGIVVDVSHHRATLSFTLSKVVHVEFCFSVSFLFVPFHMKTPFHIPCKTIALIPTQSEACR